VSKDFKPKLKKPKFKEDLEIAVTILIMISVFYVLTYLGVDKILTTAIVALLGIFMEIARQVFSQAIFIIQSIPYIGPVVAKVIVWPFFITINAVAYLVTLTFIRIRGVKEVANAKLLTTVFLIGMLLGFILGRVIKII
jgi:amino acid transporter